MVHESTTVPNGPRERWRRRKTSWEREEGSEVQPFTCQSYTEIESGMTHLSTSNQVTVGDWSCTQNPFVLGSEWLQTSGSEVGPYVIHE